MNIYSRKVQYYETDKMGFVHHSNYLRWFEESRVDFLQKIGAPYDLLEAEGCFSPVLSLECQFKKSLSFGDEFEIETRLTEFGRVRFQLSYRVFNRATHEVCATGSTSHCFIGEDGHAISLKRRLPEYAALLEQVAAADALLIP